MFFKIKQQNGQILLVVILAAVISLTVGLAAVSRTIVNTKVTTEEANSQKALSAAEAGIEELAGNPVLLAADLGSTKELSNDSKFEAKATEINGTQILLNGGGKIYRDDGADIWLSKYPTFSPQWSGSLSIYWKSTGNCPDNAALEIVVLSGLENSPTLRRYPVDSCSRGNNFPSVAASSYSVKGDTYQYKYTLPDVITNGFVARVIPLYADTNIAAEGSVALPSQGNIITSTGASGNTKRTVQVVKGYPRVPIEIFPYNIFLPQ